MTVADPPSSGQLLAAVADDRRTALVLRLSRVGRRASVLIAVLRAGHLPLVLAEDDVPVVDDRWELRSSGLWIEAVCETPDAHWSYGLEAFALAIDEPDELLARGYGHRTPLGWELDFEAGGGPPAGRGAPLQGGRVDGLVLTGPGVEGELALGGPGRRGSWDGNRTEPIRWALDLPAVAGPPVEVALPGGGSGAPGSVWWVGHDGRELTVRWTQGPPGQR